MVVLEVDFPCGYHLKIIRSPLEWLSIDESILVRCPLHGKQCQMGRSKK